MAPQKLTKRTVDALPLRDRVYIAYDELLPGFGCRVTPNGARSWIVEYRPHGGGRSVGKRRITLGPVSVLTPDQAREAAGDVLAKVRFGDDAPYDRATRRSSPMVAELIDAYMNDEVRPTRKPRTADLYDMYFRVHVRPVLGNKRAREVTSTDVGKLHRKIGTKTPVTANRVVALLSSLFSWAARLGKVPKDLNPARGITRYREEGIERFLSSEELARLGDALREAETVGVPWVVDESNPKAKHVPKDNRRTRVSPHCTAAVRLLLLTGCRLREILNLRWEEFDRERGMLLLPDSKTGRKPVVLSGAAIAVLEGIPRAGDYVIAGLRPERARQDLKRPWEAIRHRAALGPIRLHDLRHTFAATGAGSNLGLPVIGKLLGHRSAETTSRYAHIAADPLKIAADAIASKLSAKIGDPPMAAKDGGQVIQAGTDVSCPSAPGRQPPPAEPGQKGLAEDPDKRLVPNIRVSKSMKPFVNRMRIRVTDLDLTDPGAADRLELARQEMANILKKKKISATEADQIIAETLDAAANHRLENLRRDQNLDDLAQANSNLNRLIEHVECLARSLAKLARPIKDELNKIMAGLNWRQFNTEIFAEFMHAILDLLADLGPSRFTADARSSIIDSRRSSNDPVVTKIERTAPPAILELWETIPAATRTQVEFDLRAWASCKRRSVIGFLDHLVALLDQHREKIGRGRHLAIEARYVQAVEAIWRRHGLEADVGLAFDHLKGDKGENIESRFQRFGRLALEAVGDRSSVSRWQVSKVKSRAKMAGKESK